MGKELEMTPDGRISVGDLVKYKSHRGFRYCVVAKIEKSSDIIMIWGNFTDSADSALEVETKINTWADSTRVEVIRVNSWQERIVK